MPTRPITHSLLAIAILAAAAPTPAAAQTHPHPAGAAHQHDAGSHAMQPAAPSAGQAAFATIAEIVAALDADPATDWSRVDIEALRQHLIDMDEVTMRADVRAIALPGGARFELRGATPRTVAAIRRMLAAHAPTLRQESGYRVTLAEATNGIDLTVLAPEGADAGAVGRIRGLGAAGLMTLGAHHAPHHLAIARGAGAHAHH